MQAASLQRPCMALTVGPRQRAVQDAAGAGSSSRYTRHFTCPLPNQVHRSTSSPLGEIPGAQRRLGGSRLHAAVVGDGLTEAQRQQQGGNGAGAAAAAAAAAATLDPQQQQQQQQRQPLVRDPEEFQLQPGELSYIARGKPLSNVDVFRCAACSRPECQVR